jgi:hypothetical protein
MSDSLPGGDRPFRGSGGDRFGIIFCGMKRKIKGRIKKEENNMTELIIAAAASVVAFALGYLANHLYRQMKLNKKIGLKDEAEVIIDARKEAEKVRVQGG